MVREFESRIGLTAVSAEPALDLLSPSLCHSPTCTLSKINIKKIINIPENHYEYMHRIYSPTLNFRETFPVFIYILSRFCILKVGPF